MESSRATGPLAGRGGFKPLAQSTSSGPLSAPGTCGVRVEIHALALYAFKFGLPSCFHSKKLGPSRANAVPASGSFTPSQSPNLLLENCLLVGPRLFERLSHEALHFEFVKDSRDVRRGIAEGWGAAQGRSPSARDLKVYLNTTLQKNLVSLQHAAYRGLGSLHIIREAFPFFCERLHFS
jgi:hypothetical protein